MYNLVKLLGQSKQPILINSKDSKLVNCLLAYKVVLIAKGVCSTVFLF
jgi:hypothetical protein